MKFLNLLTEAGISFGGKAYPNSDNVVILAGGAGSGKGFVLENILLINGKIFDVDKLKTELIGVSDKANKKELKDSKWNRILTTSNIDAKFRNYLKNEWKYGDDKQADERVKDILRNEIKLKDLDLSKPENTGILHLFSDYLDIDTKMKTGFFDNLAMNPNLSKPNVIFDVTLKNTKALAKIYKLIRHAGYSPLNTHLVWILNDIKIARAQNLKRSRHVADAILDATHKGASNTMKEIINNFDSTIEGLNGVKISDMIQGDVWIVPNKEGEDSVLVTKNIPYDPNLQKYNIKQYVPKIDKTGKPKEVETLITIKSFNKYQIKERGKDIKTLKDVENEGMLIFNTNNLELNDKTKFIKTGDIAQKINSYVPSDVATW